jgi:hypothetical protein
MSTMMRRIDGDSATGQYFGREVMTKRVLGTIGFGMLAAAMIALGGGCSTDNSTSGENGGGGGVYATGGSSTAGQNAGGVAGGGGGAASQFEASSNTICTKEATLNCPNDLTVDACTTALVGQAEFVVGPQCPAATVLALYECWAAASPTTDMVCDDQGQAGFRSGVCATQQAAVDACP